MPPSPLVSARRFARWEENIFYDPNTGCWIWFGAQGGSSHKYGGLYGQVSINNRHYRTHRVYYENLVGPVPDGLVLDHLCRLQLCVNPSHMEPVTDRVNVLRGVGFAAINAQKTHCMNGHDFSDSKVCLRYQDAAGRWRRQCRICNVAKLRLFRQKQKLANDAILGDLVLSSADRWEPTG